MTTTLPRPVAKSADRWRSAVASLIVLLSLSVSIAIGLIVQPRTLMTCFLLDSQSWQTVQTPLQTPRYRSVLMRRHVKPRSFNLFVHGSGVITNTSAADTRQDDHVGAIGELLQDDASASRVLAHRPNPNAWLARVPGGGHWTKPSRGRRGRSRWLRNLCFAEGGSSKRFRWLQHLTLCGIGGPGERLRWLRHLMLGSQGGRGERLRWLRHLTLFGNPCLRNTRSGEAGLEEIFFSSLGLRGDVATGGPRWPPTSAW